jgi:DNA-binding SARP family transcriptional activator
MLAFLATRGEVRRDELIELLWGGSPEANARNAFRQALHRLRWALGEEVIPQDRGRVALRRVPGRLISVDRDRFLAHIEAGQLLEAAELYRGDFLEGVTLGEPSFDQWVESERTRLRSQAQALLRQVTQTSFENGQTPRAAEFAQRLSRLAPFDEDAALLEATVLVAAGRREEAVGTLRRFSARLEEDLDLVTSAKVSDMLSRIERSSGSSATKSGRAAASAPSTVPFIGLEPELSKLLSLVGELSRERGATVVIEGAAGAGKSRLAAELIARASSLAPLLVLRGRERASAAVPYASIAEALRGVLRAPGIAGTSQHLLAEAARILPELRDAFPLPPLPATDSTTTEDAASRLRLYEGVAALLDGAAYEQSLCIVIDDLQHASSSTLDMLGYLSGRLQSSPVLFLLLYRPEAATSQLTARFASGGTTNSDESASLEADDRATRITLRPWTPDRSATLVQALVQTRANPTGGIDVERIVAAGGGNPAKLIQLTRSALAGELPNASPVELKDVLWARLQTCAPSQRRLFFAAALLQRHAPLSLLAAAAHLPESTALDAARELERLGLLTEVGPGFVLAHDFTVEFVVAASGTAGRALLSGWAADALAHEDQRADAELAHLYALAGRTKETFTHARLAAFRALVAYAGPEAHRLLGLALTFAPDESSRREIERLMAATGSGPKRIATSFDGGANLDEAEGLQKVSREEFHSDASPVTDQSHPSKEPATSASFSFRRDLRIRGWVFAAAVVTIAGVAGLRAFQASRRATGRVLSDSLLVIDRGNDRGRYQSRFAQVITGDVGVSGDGVVPRGSVPRVEGPRWIDSLVLPWINPLPSPDGRFVSVERIGSGGTDVYAISVDRRDTLPLAIGGGQDIALGWSPDSRYLLVSRARTLPNGSFDSDLFAYSIDKRSVEMRIDTSSDRAVTEAAWSPTGTHVAWVARVGANRQQDVFVSRPDGSELRNVSDDPAEDYHIAWSPDGTLIGFTSERSGTANLYAMDISSSRLWRLTSGTAHDDGLIFSPDGRYAAFESTRGGMTGVYLMPALGGSPTRVTPAGRQFVLSGWRGARPPYIDRLRIMGPSTVALSDSASWGVIAVDSHGGLASPREINLGSEKSRAARVLRVQSGSSVTDSAQAPTLSVRALDSGMVRVMAGIPGWRADTLLVRLGAAENAMLQDAFSSSLDTTRWIALGIPQPSVGNRGGTAALYPRADFEWESGVLSRAIIDVRENLSIQATIHARFDELSTAASSLRLALVSPADLGTLDRDAPQLTDVVAVAWNGESRRVTYTVDRESWSEPAGALGAGRSHLFRMLIQEDGRVAFYADERLRWTSTLLVPFGNAALKGQLWLGGRATGDWGAFSNVRVALDGVGGR